MNAHKAVGARLAGFAGLTALVGTRIVPGVLSTKATYPAVTYIGISSSIEVGPTTNPGLSQARVQVTSFGRTRLEALTVAAQVRLALDRLRKTTSGGVTVDDCFFLSEVDLFDDDAQIYYLASDYRIHFRE